MTASPEVRARRAEVLARVASQHASKTDAERQETEARLHEAEARTLRAYAAASRAHAESRSAVAAIDDLRDVFKRWFLDAHAGLTLADAMKGIAEDMQRVLDTADEWKTTP
jgi:hypothetical protein